MVFNESKFYFWLQSIYFARYLKFSIIIYYLNFNKWLINKFLYQINWLCCFFQLILEFTINRKKNSFLKILLKRIFLYFYNMNTYSKKFSLTLLLIFSVFSTISAAPGDPPPPTPPPPPGLPIDNGIIYLLILGLIYGFYKLNKLKFQSKK